MLCCWWRDWRLCQPFWFQPVWCVCKYIQLSSHHKKVLCCRCLVPVRASFCPLQCFFSSQTIGKFTPKIIYFHYLRNYFLDQSNQKMFPLILKTEELVLCPPALCSAFCVSADVSVTAPQNLFVFIKNNSILRDECVPKTFNLNLKQNHWKSCCGRRHTSARQCLFSHDWINYLGDTLIL